jgi:hypothetical protein
MDSKYTKAIMVGVTAVVLLIFILAFCIFMMDWQTKQYYKAHGTYDDFGALIWLLLFLASLFVVSFLEGAVVVFWAYRDLSSIKDAIMASAISGSFPVFTIILVSLALFLIMSYNSLSYQSPLSLFMVQLVQLLSLVFYLIIMLSLSVVSGVLCYFILPKLGKGIKGISFNKYVSSIMVGVAGSIPIIIFYVVAYYLTINSSSLIIYFIGSLVFSAIAYVVGVVSVMMMPPGSIMDGLKTSLVAGLVLGIGGVIGRQTIPLLNHYNFLGILLFYGISHLFMGIIFASIAGFLYTVVVCINKGTVGRSQYNLAIVYGVISGIVLLLCNLAPSIQWFIGNPFAGGTISIFTMTQLIASPLTTFLIISMVAVLFVMRSGGKTLNEAASGSGVIGAILGLVAMVGDVLGSYLNLSNPLFNEFKQQSPSLTMELFSANAGAVIQGAPFKMIVIIGFTVLVAVVFGALARDLKYSAGNDAKKQA